MPRLWRSLFGPLVITKGQVIKGAASPGQQCWIGNLLKSTSSPSRTISWQGAFLTTLALKLNTFLNIGSLDHASFRPLGGSGSFKNANNLPTSRSASTLDSPMPMATRFGVPNKFASTGTSEPTGFSNNRAGPPARRVRSQISVISSLGSTGMLMRFSSPCFSSWSMKSRKSLYFIFDREM